MSGQTGEKDMMPVSPWHAERGCIPGGFCRLWGRRHPRTVAELQRARASARVASPHRRSGVVPSGGGEV